MQEVNHPMPTTDVPTSTPDMPDSASESTPDPEAKLSPRQRAALELMALGTQDIDIAQALTVARKTLYNWRTHHPTFKAALAERRTQLFAQQADRLCSLLTNALTTLETQLKDPYTNTSHRAAKTLLTLSKIQQLLHPAPPAP